MGGKGKPPWIKKKTHRVMTRKNKGGEGKLPFRLDGAEGEGGGEKRCFLRIYLSRKDGKGGGSQFVVPIKREKKKKVSGAEKQKKKKGKQPVV